MTRDEHYDTAEIYLDRAEDNIDNPGQPWSRLIDLVMAHAALASVPLGRNTIPTVHAGGGAKYSVEGQ